MYLKKNYTFFCLDNNYPLCLRKGFFFYAPLAFLGATIAGIFLKLFDTPDWLTYISADVAFIYTIEGVKSLIEWIVK